MHQLTQRSDQTNGDSKWQKRVETLVDAGIARFFPKDTGILTEMCERKDAERACSSASFWWQGRTLPLYASAVKMAPFVADKLMPGIQKSGQKIVDHCLSARNAFTAQCKGPEGDRDVGVQFDITGLGAASVLFLEEAAASVTQKAGGTSSSSSDAKIGGSKSDKDSSAAENSIGRLTCVLIMVSVAGSYLI